MTWELAGRDPAYRERIHPTGHDDREYESTGKLQALQLASMLRRYGVKHVLDYGCGDGRLLRHFAGSDIDAAGVDVVPEFVSAARRHTADVHHIDAPDLRGRAFDAIFSVSVFIYLADCQAEKALHWIASHLRPGGLAFVEAPIYGQPTAWQSWIGVRTYTIDTLLQMARSAGLEPHWMSAMPGQFSYDYPHEWLQAIQIFKEVRRAS